MILAREPSTSPTDYAVNCLAGLKASEKDLCYKVRMYSYSSEHYTLQPVSHIFQQFIHRHW